MRSESADEGEEGAPQDGPPLPQVSAHLTDGRVVPLSPEQVAELQAAVAEQSRIAALHRNAYVELAAQGRHEEALAEAVKAIYLAREIIDFSPPPLGRRELAGLLLCKHECLLRLHRPEGLVEAAAEAVAIMRELAEDDFDGLSQDYGMALSALSIDLNVVGRYEEAVAVVADSIRHWYRMDRAGLHPLRANLAGALVNESTMLENLGRHDEALLVGEEAVAIYRELAEANPGENRRHFAAALNNLSVRFGRVGRDEEALDAVAEAIVLRRALAASKGTFEAWADLSTSLGNQSSHLAALRRLEEALGAASEAVSIMRQLAEVRPEQATEALAAWLTNQGRCLANLGRHQEAVERLTESVALFERLSQVQPNLKEKLSISQRLLGAELDEVGQGREAEKVRGKARAVAPGVPDQQRDRRAGPSFSQALAALDALTEESIRASFASRERADPAEAAAWRSRYGLTQAEVRADKTVALADRRRAAYLAGLVADGIAPTEGRHQDGFLELAWHCGWDGLFALRWDEAFFVSGSGPVPDVEDLVRLWELRHVAPDILSGFAGGLARVVFGPADVRLVLDKLVARFEPGSPAMAAAIEALNEAPQKEGGTLLERLDVDAVIAESRVKKLKVPKWLRLDKDKTETAPEVPGPDQVMAPLFDHAFKYVWAISSASGEPHGHRAREQKNGVTVSRAGTLVPGTFICGEAWFSTKKDVYVTNASSICGVTASVSHWLLAIKFWEALGYRVHPVRFSSYEVLSKWRAALP